MTDNNKATGNDKLRALQQELLQYKHDNEELRTLLKEKTNTLNATILKKSQQFNQQRVKLEEEIEKYCKTKAVYQSIVDEHKSLKTHMHTLQHQLIQQQKDLQQSNTQLKDVTQSFEQRENGYQNMIGKYKNDINKLQQQMMDDDKNHLLQMNQLNDKHNLEIQQNDDNDLVRLIVNRMCQQTDKRDRTQLMSCKVNGITFTELQARFSELMLAFQKEYNAHQIALSQIKQLECLEEMKRVEIESIKSETVELSNNYHKMRIKCSKYSAIYGDINDKDHETLHKTLSLQNKLAQTIYDLNEYKKEIHILKENFDKDIERRVSQQITSISSQNKRIENKMEQMEIMCKDKDESLARYKSMNEELSNALLSVRQNKEHKEHEHKDTEDPVESELELCQRMYRDRILQLQQTMDKCNKERSVVEGENVTLRQQYNDLYQQNKRLNETKAYLNEIIKKQKVKCSNINANISEQQMYIEKLQNKYSELNDDYVAMNTKYVEIQIKHDLLQQNEVNNNKENMNYRIQNVEIKKLISSLKNETKTYKEQYIHINDKFRKLDQLHKALESKLKAIQKEDIDKSEIQKENEALKNDVFNLKQKISVHQCDINNISKQLQISHKNESLIPNLKSEIEQLNEEINELKVNISVLEQQNMDQDNESVRSNKSTPDKSELKQRFKELRQIAIKSQLENERLIHQVEEYESFHNTKTRELTQKLEQHNNKLSHLQCTESKQKELIHEWKDRYTKAQSRYERELKNHAQSLQNIKELKQQMNASKVSSMANTMDISTISTPQNEDLHCAVLEAEVIACKSTVDRLKNENEIISSELITVKEELRKQQQSMSIEPKSQSLSSDIGIVSVEIFNTLQNKYNETQDGLHDMNRERKDLQIENKEYNIRCNTLENENNRMDEKMKRMIKENERLKERNLSYLSTYPQIDPQDFDNAKQEVQLLTEQLKQQTEQYNQMTTEEKQRIMILDTYKQQIQTEKMRYKELSELMQNTLDAVDKTKKNNAAEREGLNNKMKAKDMMIGKLQSDVQKGKDLIGKMKDLLTKKGGVITAKQQQMDRLTKQIQNRVDEIKSLKVALDKASKTEKSLRLDILTKGKQLKDKENEYNSNVIAFKEAKKADIEALEDDKKLLMEQMEKEKKSKAEINDMMATTLDSHDKEISLKNKEIDTLQSESTKMKQLIEKMKNVLTAKKQQSVKLQSVYNETKRVLNEKIVGLEEENKELKDIRDNLKNKIKSQSVELGEVLHEKEKSVENKDKQHDEYEKQLALRAQKIQTLNTNLNEIKRKYQKLSVDSTKYLNISIESATNQQKLKKTIQEKDKSIQLLNVKLQSTKKALETLVKKLKQNNDNQSKLESELKQSIASKQKETEQESNKIKILKEEYKKVYHKLQNIKTENTKLIQQKESELNETKQELQQKNESIKSVMSILDKYKTTKKELQQTNDQQTQKLTQLQQELEQKTMRCKELSKLMQNTLDAVDKTKKSNVAEMEGLNNKMKANDTMIGKLQSDVQKGKDLIGKMKELLIKKGGVITSNQQQMDKLQQELEQKTMRSKELSELMQNTLDAVDKTKKNLKSQHVAEIEELNNKIKAKDMVIGKMKELMIKKSGVITSKQQQMDKLQQELEQKTIRCKEFSELMQNTLDDVDKTKKKIKSQHAEIEELNNKMKAKDMMIGKKKELLTSKQQQMDKLQQQLEQKTNDIFKLKKEVNELQLIIKDNETQFNTLQEQITNIKQTLEQKKQELAEKDENLKSLRETNDKLKNIENEGGKRMKQIQSEMSALQQRLEQMEQENKTLKTNEKETSTLHTKEMETLQSKLKEESIKYENICELAKDYQKQNKTLKDRLNKLELDTQSLSQEIEKMTKELLQKKAENQTLQQTLNDKQNEETQLQSQIKQLEDGTNQVKKQLLMKEKETKDQYKKRIKSLETEICELKCDRTDKELRKQYNELQKLLSEAKKMLMKEKRMRNQLEKKIKINDDLISMQQNRIQTLTQSQQYKARRSPSKSPSKSPRRSPKSSLYTLPAITTSTVTISKKRRLDAIALDSDSDDDDDNTDTKIPPKKRHKTSSNTSAVIDLTSESKPRAKRLKSPNKKNKSSLDGLSVERKSASEMNAILKKKLQKLQKRNKSPTHQSRSWCSLSVNFSESNSLDPESVDSSFPIFEVYFTPLNKENITNWKKPFIEMLRVNERLNYAQFTDQTKFNEWIKKEIPSNIGLFKCEHQLTPNKTKTNNFVQVNKLLADKKCVGFVEYRSEYKMYFIPSSSQISTLLNKQYQKQMEVAHDRMWVIWLKK